MSVRSIAMAAVAALAASVLLFSGCEVNSANVVNRNVGVDYTGIYTGTATTNGTIATQNSGAPITQFNLSQTGDILEAVDNNGAIWKGSIGNSPDATSPQASFTMKGKTTVGANVTISGALNKTAATATTATMSGTWIEPNFFATISAAGSVSITATNTSSGGAITVSPASTTVAIGQSAGFTASGASGTITWSVSGNGSLSTTTGTTTTFTRTSAGSASLTATSSGGSGTAIIN